MLISDRRITEQSDATDGNATWTPAKVLTGLLEVMSNSNPATVKTFPTGANLAAAIPNVAAFDAIELLIWNGGEDPFTLVKGDGGDSFWGDDVVPAGTVSYVKIIFFSATSIGIFHVRSGS